jgi:hypothetical protein
MASPAIGFLSSGAIIKPMNKDDIKNIAIAVVSVLVVLAIAGALFLKGDSDIALLFGIIGVPVIIAVASAWYIKSVKQRRLEDPASRVVHQISEAAAARGSCVAGEGA